MTANVITALLLFAATMILGYTTLHVILRGLRGRRPDAVAEETPAEPETPEEESARLAINDSMGYEFIRVVRPGIASDVLSQDEGTGYAQSRGTGMREEPVLRTAGPDDGQEEDDESYWDSHGQADWDDDSIEYGIDESMMDEDFYEDERRMIEDAMKKASTIKDDLIDYYEQHPDEAAQLESAYAVPDDGGEMNDYQRSALGMEGSIGSSPITMDDLEDSIGMEDDTDEL